jgi:hypothetical protein
MDWHAAKPLSTLRSGSAREDGWGRVPVNAGLCR